jgi:methyl-accepting chemotaxis protein
MRGMVAMRSAIEGRTQDAADQRMALESERAKAADEAQAKQRESESQKAVEIQSLQRETERRQSVERRTLREELARDFEGQVAGIVDSVAATIENLKTTAANLALSAESTSRSSADASTVAETTKHAASKIAASSAELSRAAQAVRANAEQSKTRAALGAQEATAARAEIDFLSVASGEINSIAELIAGVTRQTNLLAINARIEAARAGEAGRGFCIVADEVKTLAAQSREAADGIGGRVGQVSAAADRSIEILQNMRSIISELEAGSSGIFAACDDQSKSTDAIVSQVTEISSSTVSVAENIARAEKTARATEAMAAQVVATADDLQLQANSLQDQVANFVLQLTAVADSANASATEAISQPLTRKTSRFA